MTIKVKVFVKCWLTFSIYNISDTLSKGNLKNTLLSQTPEKQQLNLKQTQEQVGLLLPHVVSLCN